jgi:cephalosporin hydroxylase
MGYRDRIAPDTFLNVALAAGIQRGHLAHTYKGIPTGKCPFDLALYQEIIWDLKPGTILEFGSYKGGSALWVADMLRAFLFENTRLITLEDGIISLIMDEEDFDGGPFQATHTFLAAHPDVYQIDRERCDRFGRNVTWNLDGYILRVR